MTLTLLFQVILAVFQFPAAMASFIKLLSKTPAEQEQDIVEQVNAMVDVSQSGDRPTWGL